MYGKVTPRGHADTPGDVIEKPQDWEHLPVLSPSSPHLAGQLACLPIYPRWPVPGNSRSCKPSSAHWRRPRTWPAVNRLIVHLRQHPEAVLKGLEIIAKTTRRFVEACLEIGLDGVFYAVQHAQAGFLTLDEYKTFGLPNDLTSLEPASSLWCNLLHLHGLNVYFDLIYPIPVS